MEKESWHLDKKIPISLILAIIAQTLVGVSYVTGLSNTVSQSVKDITKLEGRINAAETKSIALQESLIRLEEQSKQQTKMLERIVNSLDKLNITTR